MSFGPSTTYKSDVQFSRIQLVDLPGVGDWGNDICSIALQYGPWLSRALLTRDFWVNELLIPPFCQVLHWYQP